MQKKDILNSYGAALKGAPNASDILATIEKDLSGVDQSVIDGYFDRQTRPTRWKDGLGKLRISRAFRKRLRREGITYKDLLSEAKAIGMSVDDMLAEMEIVFEESRQR